MGNISFILPKKAARHKGFGPLFRNCLHPQGCEKAGRSAPCLCLLSSSAGFFARLGAQPSPQADLPGRGHL